MTEAYDDVTLAAINDDVTQLTLCLITVMVYFKRTVRFGVNSDDLPYRRLGISALVEG